MAFALSEGNTVVVACQTPPITATIVFFKVINKVQGKEQIKCHFLKISVIAKGGNIGDMEVPSEHFLQVNHLFIKVG